jgi:hypothetical protein
VDKKKFCNWELRSTSFERDIIPSLVVVAVLIVIIMMVMMMVVMMVEHIKYQTTETTINQ